jgi:hypothetical protein
MHCHPERSEARTESKDSTSVLSSGGPRELLHHESQLMSVAKRRQMLAPHASAGKARRPDRAPFRGRQPTSHHLNAPLVCSEEQTQNAPNGSPPSPPESESSRFPSDGTRTSAPHLPRNSKNIPADSLRIAILFFSFLSLNFAFWLVASALSFG